jgi:hypothetical protein
MNSAILLLAGPFVALCFFGVGWIVDRPNSLDAWPLLRAMLTLGTFVGAAACIAYLGGDCLKSIGTPKRCLVSVACTP